MKYLILILVVLAVMWLVRSKPRAPSAEPASAPPRKQETMLACAQCGLHLPRDEALPGRGGVFCGEAHRAAYEKAHPNG